MVAPKITDHIAQAKDRLLSQYKEKPRVEGLLEAFVQDFEDLEDCFYKMYVERSVNSAIGAQLDVIGNIVGQTRDGWDDAAYRILILGKIGVNISQGRPEDLIALFKILMKCTKAHYYPYFPAECEIMGNFAPVDTEQLLVDGNMEAAGTTAWTAVNDATLTKNADHHGSLSTQSLRIEWNGTADPGASQIMLAVGEWYWFRGWVKTDGVTGHIPVIYNGATALQIFATYGSFYDIDVIFQATDTSLVLGSEFDEVGWVQYDSCACRRLLISNMSQILDACQDVIPAGVKLIGVGWYNDNGHNSVWDGDDEEDPDDPDDPDLNVYFSFDGDPDGLGFGDALDPTVGGKFASLFFI